MRANNFSEIGRNRAFTVRVNGQVIARYHGYHGYQVATNQAYDLNEVIKAIGREGHDMVGYVVTVNNKNIEEILK